MKPTVDRLATKLVGITLRCFVLGVLTFAALAIGVTGRYLVAGMLALTFMILPLYVGETAAKYQAANETYSPGRLAILALIAVTLGAAGDRTG